MADPAAPLTPAAVQLAALLMRSPLLRSWPANQRVPCCYGLVVSDLHRHRHWIAPIPLNHLLRWALAVWMGLRNPVPPGQVDHLSARLLARQAYSQGFSAGQLARFPKGTALIHTSPTRSAVVAAWHSYPDAEELVQAVLTAAIRSGPDPRHGCGNTF
jgi:hypothetical protein